MATRGRPRKDPVEAPPKVPKRQGRPPGPNAKPAKPRGPARDNPGLSNARAAVAHRREAFVIEYLANGQNGYQAALKAGYPPACAAQQATAILKHPQAKALIAKHRADLEAALKAKHGLTIERVLEELSRLALGDVRELYHPDGTLKGVHELGDRAASMVAGVEQTEINTDGVVTGFTKKVKLWDKNTALTNAMKHLGLFEKDNNQGKEITVTITSDDAGVL